MDKICIRGNRSLEGKVAISGSKNSTLPALAATLLTPEQVILSNVPDLQDITSMLELLQYHGVKYNIEGNSSEYGSADRKVTLQANQVKNFEAPYDLVRKMRASVWVLGPLLARFKEARVSLPGGCAIGTRPVDLHIEALRMMGAEIDIALGYINARCKNGLKGADIRFAMVSVGATVNALMAATLAEGQTVLRNVAQEPEIVDLAVLLNKMGAKIFGAGTDTITVEGVEALYGTQHKIIPDRIETGTYAVAAAITKGNLEITNTDPSLLEDVLTILEMIGCDLERSDDAIKISRSGIIKPINLETAPYPRFPTDLQAQLMALLCLADGNSSIRENIFESRFMHAPELNRLGADIKVNGNTAYINGVKKLKGAQLMATDLRASVSLILAALASDDTTIIHRVYHLDRGYEHLEAKLRACGAIINRIS